MDKKEINAIIERQIRQQRWAERPQQLRDVYDSISGDMGRQCALAGHRHRSQVNATRMLLILLFLLTTPFSIKALTRDYPCRFVADNGVYVPTGVIESIDIIFNKQ